MPAAAYIKIHPTSNKRRRKRNPHAEKNLYAEGDHPPRKEEIAKHKKASP
jgi:hypothetical protein